MEWIIAYTMPHLSKISAPIGKNSLSCKLLESQNELREKLATRQKWEQAGSLK